MASSIYLLWSLIHPRNIPIGRWNRSALEPLPFCPNSLMWPCLRLTIIYGICSCVKMRWEVCRCERIWYEQENRSQRNFEKYHPLESPYPGWDKISTFILTHNLHVHYLTEGESPRSRLGIFCEVTGKTEFRITLTQGLNRQIRRMCQALHCHVVGLKRVRIMNLRLGNLKTGTYRKVTAEEYEKLLELLQDSRG